MVCLNLLVSCDTYLILIIAKDNLLALVKWDKAKTNKNICKKKKNSKFFMLYVG